MLLHNTIKAATIIMVLLATGCANVSNNNEDEIIESDHLIQITQEQFDSDNMKIGEVIIHNFEDAVICNGYITAPTNGMAQISTHISGKVETIDCSLGDYVKKGQVLSTLSSNELIILQQNFIETSAKLISLKADYERRKALINENIGAQKDFVAAESAFKVITAKYQSLKLQLELLTLNVGKIEDGELYSVFPVIAAIDGYITSINIVLGQNIDPAKNLMEIVDVNKLQLQLSVFENDVVHLEIGQNIRFNSLGEQNSIHNAILTSVGKTINPESKMIQCIAKIINEDASDFINRSYIEASIIINQNKAAALPNEAIVKSGKDYYVFVVEKIDNQTYFLQKVKVVIGRTSKGFSEIINGGDLTKVITNGVYNLP